MIFKLFLNNMFKFDSPRRVCFVYQVQSKKLLCHNTLKFNNHTLQCSTNKIRFFGGCLRLSTLAYYNLRDRDRERERDNGRYRSRDRYSCRIEEETEVEIEIKTEEVTGRETGTLSE